MLLFICRSLFSACGASWWDIWSSPLWTYTPNSVDVKHFLIAGSVDSFPNMGCTSNSVCPKSLILQEWLLCTSSSCLCLFTTWILCTGLRAAIPIPPWRRHSAVLGWINIWFQTTGFCSCHSNILNTCFLKIDYFFFFPHFIKKAWQTWYPAQESIVCLPCFLRTFYELNWFQF